MTVKTTEAAKLLGSVTSKKKARAARQNGKLGGRPKNAEVSREYNNDARKKLDVRSKGSKKVIKVKRVQTK